MTTKQYLHVYPGQIWKGDFGDDHHVTLLILSPAKIQLYGRSVNFHTLVLDSYDLSDVGREVYRTWTMHICHKEWSLIADVVQS